jgi:6-phosphogluconolactonase
MKKYFFLFFLLPQVVTAQQLRLVVGTYTNTTSEGIYVYNFDAQTTTTQLISSTKAVNPSYLTLSLDGKKIYAVSETKNGMASSYSILENGSLQLINSVETNGANPCYIAIDKEEKLVTVGNYSGGNLSVYNVQENGELSEAAQTIQHKGSSVNKQRQEQPHVHATVFTPDNRFVLVPDLGIDKVMIYKINSKAGRISSAASDSITTASGAGPRHIDFHPNGSFFYLMEELSGTVSAYSYKKGRIKSLQTISSHPADFTGTKGSADIHVSPDGKFLYASNRGTANSIAIFSIDPKKGTLTSVGFQSTLGIKPRNFTIDPSGNFLLVANQESDEIVIFKRDVATGILSDTQQRIKVPRPVCLKWIP